MNKHRLTIGTTSIRKEKITADYLLVYLPVTLRKEANIKAGDRFDVRIVNNKCAIRYSVDGDYKLNKANHLYLRVELFKPPLIEHASTPVDYAIKDEWLAFQIPKEFEYIDRGFHLLGSESE